MRRREYWALVKLNFSKNVRGINPLFDIINSHLLDLLFIIFIREKGYPPIFLLFFFFSVHWKQVTTSPVCFGASANSSGHFVTPIAGDLLTFKLVHQNGSVECAQGFSSHWGCTHPNVPQDQPLGTIITNSQSVRLLPKADYFLIGSSCYYYGLPGQTADSQVLQFDNFSIPLHVSVGEEFQIWFGEDLYRCGHEDNGQGKTCVLVFGLFV